MATQQTFDFMRPREPRGSVEDFLNSVRPPPFENQREPIRNIIAKITEYYNTLNSSKSKKILRQIILKGHTGTGKTHVFIYATIFLLLNDIIRPHVVISTSTRNLVQQIFNTFKDIVDGNNFNIELIPSVNTNKFSFTRRTSSKTPPRVSIVTHSLLYNRFRKRLDGLKAQSFIPGLIILDESHRTGVTVRPEGPQGFHGIGRVIEHYALTHNIPILRASATPRVSRRAGNKGRPTIAIAAAKRSPTIRTHQQDLTDPLRHTLSLLAKLIDNRLKKISSPFTVKQEELDTDILIPTSTDLSTLLKPSRQSGLSRADLRILAGVVSLARTAEDLCCLSYEDVLYRLMLLRAQVIKQYGDWRKGGTKQRFKWFEIDLFGIGDMHKLYGDNNPPLQTIAAHLLQRLREGSSLRRFLSRIAYATTTADLGNILCDYCTQGGAQPKEILNNLLLSEYNTLLSEGHALKDYIDEKDAKVLELISSALDQGEKILIYVQNVSACARLAELINRYYDKQSNPIAYPFTSTKANRKSLKNHITLLKDFETGDISILVATSAFREGIDVSRIGRLILYHLPPNLEDFIQLLGRIGRSPLPSDPNPQVDILARGLREQSKATSFVRGYHRSI